MLDSEQFFPPQENQGPDTAQALPSGPTYPMANYQRLVVSALHNAHDHVTITTPYLVPDDALLQAIEVAALRGVDVEIVVPEKYDKILVGAASKAYYEELLECGAKLYLYPQGLLHAKSMTVDNTIGVFGSSNFDIRSFVLNFELNLLLYGAKETEALRAIQRHYMEQSTPLTADAWKRRAWPTRVGQNLAKLFSPLL